MWRQEIPNHIPKSCGPYVPGCCDVMTEYTKTGLFLRLYYPAESERNIHQSVNRWIPWLSDESYLPGIGKVLKLWLFIVRLVIWIISGKLHVPVIYGAKVKTDLNLKCILLSHGLGGHRFLYTATCIELASHGFVVAAVEHRDESACRTYYYRNKSDVTKDQKTFIEHLMVKLGTNHYTLRHNQVLQRSEECKNVLEFLINVNKGVLPYNILSDLPRENSNDFELRQLQGRLDIDNMIIMGHSFGAATALVTLANEPRFKLGILLDSWMFPIKDVNLTEKMSQPLLFINTQTFHIASNVRAMEPLLNVQNKSVRQMYTIRHTTHESQTDSVFVVGYWLNWFMKKLDPECGIKINSALVLQFLHEQMGSPEDIAGLKELLHKEAANYYYGITQPWA